jgi:hypothetical protein
LVLTLSKAGLVIQDISTDTDTYKGKDEEWWEDQGGTLLERILDSFAGGECGRRG